MMKRIEEYDNYRVFLKDFYAYQKELSPSFSYRVFCKKAKINSPSFYKEVVDGKRDLTPNMIDAFAGALKFTGTDRKYFKALVCFNQGRSTEEKQLYLEQMYALRRRVKQQVVPVDFYEYFSNWYNPVLRELACILDWKDDYTVLAKLVVPPITVMQVRESIEMLTSVGFIRKNESGRYEQSTPALSAGKEIRSVALRKYNKSMAEHGGNAIEAFPREEREIRSLTIGISRAGYDIISEEMQNFTERILRIVDDDKKNDRVYIMNMHLFPASGKNQYPTNM